MDDLARIIYVDNPEMVDYMRDHAQNEGFSFLALVWYWYIISLTSFDDIFEDDFVISIVDIFRLNY
jgi:hypothetical protein